MVERSKHYITAQREYSMRILCVQNVEYMLVLKSPPKGKGGFFYYFALNPKEEIMLMRSLLSACSCWIMKPAIASGATVGSEPNEWESIPTSRVANLFSSSGSSPGKDSTRRLSTAPPFQASARRTHRGQGRCEAENRHVRKAKC